MALIVKAKHRDEQSLRYIFVGPESACYGDFGYSPIPAIDIGGTEDCMKTAIRVGSRNKNRHNSNNRQLSTRTSEARATRD